MYRYISIWTYLSISASLSLSLYIYLCIGSLFRISDAFGVQKLIICGEGITLGRQVRKTSRATEKTVSYQFSDVALEVVQTLKNDKNYRIISLEITSKSKPIHSFKFTSSSPSSSSSSSKEERPIALVIGDENFGVSEAILSLSDAVIHIDMFGQNSSMNVVQATNIALYEITKQFM